MTRAKIASYGCTQAQIFLQSTWVELHEPHEQLVLDDCTTYPLGQLEPQL